VSVFLVTAPLYAIRCDFEGCDAEHQGDVSWRTMTDSGARQSAELAGWQIRPWRGPGSRSVPDLCPVHRNADGEA
jgi:hypothetical protein